MATRKPKPVAAQRTQRGKPPVSVEQTEQTSSTVYKDFNRWTSKEIPKWHPIKKMRYVFWRMIAGCTVADAIRELHWHESEFWHLVDLERNAPFRVEFKRAKILQGRALADSVITIAEGRDPITRKHLQQTKKLIDKAMRRIGNQKSALARKAILESVLGDLRERDKTVMTRNRLQMDAAKWIAGAVNPLEYGQKASVALGGQPDGENGEKPKPIAIQFVGPDGSVIDL